MEVDGKHGSSYALGLTFEIAVHPTICDLSGLHSFEGTIGIGRRKVPFHGDDPDDKHNQIVILPFADSVLDVHNAFRAGLLRLAEAYHASPESIEARMDTLSQESLNPNCV